METTGPEMRHMALPDSETPTVLPTKKVRKSPAIKPAKRTVEYLLQASPRTFTLPEALTVIEELSGRNTLLQNQLQEMTVNAERAFQQFRQADENFNKLSMEQRAQLKYLEDLSRVFYQSVKNAGGMR